MAEQAFILQQDFQALRANEFNHPIVSPFGFFQAEDRSEFHVPYGDPFMVGSRGPHILGAIATETVTRNRVPIIVTNDRPRFRQQTFSGKPLSDQQIAHAAQIAAKLEDEVIIRRLLGR